MELLNDIKKYDFFGIPISSYEQSTLLKTVNKAIAIKKQIVIYGFSIGTISCLREIPEIYLTSKSVDIFLTDGRNLYYLAKLLGFPLKSSLSIPEFVLLLLDYSNQKKYSVMLFGAKKSINDIATEQLKKRYNNLIVYEGIDGYYSESDESDIVKKINEISPDILLIGISSPKKELFVDKWRKRLNVPIIVPCGGMIDVLSGKLNITPRFLKNIGVAWIYRGIQNRWWTSIILPRMKTFFFMLLPRMLYSTLFKIDFSIPDLLIKGNKKKE